MILECCPLVSIFTKEAVFAAILILYATYMIAKFFFKKMKIIFDYANRLRSGMFILQRKFWSNE